MLFLTIISHVRQVTALKNMNNIIAFVCGNTHNKYQLQQTCFIKAEKNNLFLRQPQNLAGLCHCPCTCHEGRGRGGLIFPLTLYLGTRWRWVVSFLTWLLDATKNYSTHWREGWVGARACLDISEGSKVSCSYWELNFRLSSPQPSHYTDWATLAPKPCHYVNNFTISVT
jgi:hypothetical protein